MLNHCVLHPDYRWYTESWPSSEDVVKHQELHRKQLMTAEAILDFEEQRASDARGTSTSDVPGVSGASPGDP